MSSGTVDLSPQISTEKSSSKSVGFSTSTWTEAPELRLLVVYPWTSFFNGALWLKAIREAILLLFFSCGLLFGFTWLFTVLINQVEVPRMLIAMGSWFEDFIRPVLALTPTELSSKAAQFSLVYIDLVTIGVVVAWSIARGSDVVTGEMNRGTLEMLLAQPVSRSAVLMVHAIVTNLGAFLLALSLWWGSWAGLASVAPVPGVTPLTFLPCAVNILCFTISMTAVTTLFSACGQRRSLTIGLAAGVFLVSVLLKVLSRLWEPGSWLRYLSLYAPVEPQKMAVRQDQAWELSFYNDGALLLVALIAYLAAWIVFSRRDLPAPL